MRLLPPRAHACLDFLSWWMFAAAPLCFAADTPDSAAIASRATGLLGFLVCICTRYPLGLIPLISFRTHGRLELASVPVLIAMPWLAGFASSAGARDFFVASGAALLLLWAVTDYDAAGD